MFVDEDGTEKVATGAVEGRIGHAERGGEGFGYDPLFYPDAYEGRLTFAEVPQSEQNSDPPPAPTPLRATKEML